MDDGPAIVMPKPVNGLLIGPQARDKPNGMSRGVSSAGQRAARTDVGRGRPMRLAIVTAPI